MLTVLRTRDLLMKPPSRTVKFEGGSLDADISFFIVDTDPGGGPEPHRHPYAEVFVPLSGTVLFRSSDEERKPGRTRSLSWVRAPSTASPTSAPSGCGWCASTPRAGW